MTSSPPSAPPAGAAADRAAAAAGGVLPFSEALHRFATALDAEAHLRDADVEAVRRSLLRSQHVLADTAAVLDTRPDVAALDLGRPVFVVGFLRTGSTLVHNLLALHPDLHGPPLWELAHFVEAVRDPQEASRLRARAQAYVDDYFERAPLLPRIHFIDAGLPDECHRLLANTFQSMVLEMRYRVPSYGEWLHRQDLTGAYRWHRRQLQVLMSAHRRDDGTLPSPVLKCPFHTWFLAELARVYPEAAFVHLHRDPVEVVASTASLCRTVRGARSDHGDLAEIGALWAGRVTARAAVLAGQRDELLAGRPVVDVRYRDLVADPAGVLRRICDFLGLEFTGGFEAAVREHLDRHPAGARGTHRYRCEDYGLDPVAVHRATAAYRERFGVEGSARRRASRHTTTGMARMGDAATEQERRTAALVDASNRDAGDGALPVGVLTPLSPPGDPVAGELAVRGAVLGARYAAEREGLPGVRLVLENDQPARPDEPMARSAVGGLAKLALLDGVTAVVGQWHLRTTAAVGDAAEALGLPMLIENGHNTATRGRPHVFRTYFSIADRAPLMAAFVRERGWRRVAVVASDTVFAQMVADTLSDRLRESVPAVELFRTDFEQDGVADLGAELEAVARFGPDLLVNAGVVRTNYLVVSAAAAAGLLPGTPMLVGFPFPMRAEDYWRLAGEAGAGVVWAASRFSPSWPGLTAIGRWFVDAYRAEFGSFPPDNALSAFTDVTILAQAAATAGSADRDAVHAVLERASFDTWRGPVSFPSSGQDGHHAPPEIVLMHYREVGDSADEAVVVWPPEQATGEYRDPRVGAA